jgi:hypothetical protein
VIAIPNAPPWLGIGWILALIVLVLVIVLVVIAQLDTKLALLLGGLALARLL